MGSAKRSKLIGVVDSPRLIGVADVWLHGVRLLGGRFNNTVAAPGLVGDMRVLEIGIDGSIINANFYPEGGKGFGSVISPEWEHVSADSTFSAQRRVRILELKLALSRAGATMAAESGIPFRVGGAPFRAAMAAKQEAKAELEALKLTDEEKAL